MSGRLSLREVVAGLGRVEKFARYLEILAVSESWDEEYDFPVHLDIEIGGGCNLRCARCFQNGLLEGPLGPMDFGFYKGLIDEAAEMGACAVKLQGRGEPLTNKRAADCVRYAKNAGIADVRMTSNGSLLSDGLAMGLLDAGLDEMIFSVDSHHAEAFEANAGRGPYEKVEDMILDFIWRRDLASYGTWVEIHTTVGDGSAAAEEGAREDIAERFPGADSVTVGVLHDFGRKGYPFPGVARRKDTLPCDFLNTRMQVNWDGKVSVCCVDFNRTVEVGDASEMHLRAIWNGGRYEALREKHKSGNRDDIPVCRDCFVGRIDRDMGDLSGGPMRNSMVLAERAEKQLARLSG